MLNTFTTLIECFLQLYIFCVVGDGGSSGDGSHAVGDSGGMGDGRGMGDDGHGVGDGHGMDDGCCGVGDSDCGDGSGVSDGVVWVMVVRMVSKWCGGWWRR